MQNLLCGCTANSSVITLLHNGQIGLQPGPWDQCPFKRKMQHLTVRMWTKSCSDFPSYSTGSHPNRFYKLVGSVGWQLSHNINDRQSFFYEHMKFVQKCGFCLTKNKNKKFGGCRMNKKKEKKMESEERGTERSGRRRSRLWGRREEIMWQDRLHWSVFCIRHFVIFCEQ